MCTRKRGEDYISFRVSSAQVTHKFPPNHTTLGSSNGVRAPPAPVIDSAVLFDDTRAIKGTCMLGGSISDSVATKLTTTSVNPVDNRRHAVSRNSRHIDIDEFPISRTFIGACQPSWGLGETPIIRELGGRRSNRVRGSAVAHWFVGKEHPLRLPVIAFARNLKTPNPFSDLSSFSSLSGNSDVEAGLKSTDLPASELPLEMLQERSNITCFSVSDDTTSRLLKSSIDVADSIRSFDPTAIKTRDTIRALTVALEACGMIVKIEDTYVDSYP